MNTRMLSFAKQFLIGCIIVLVTADVQAQTPTAYNIRFLRGRGSNLRYYSMVVPLSGQQAAPFAEPIAATYYHLNATNSGSQDYITNRFAFTNVLASFGSQMGGPSLYLNQAYRFGIYAGDPTLSASWTNAVLIFVYSKTNNSLIDTMSLAYPDAPDTNQWTQVLTNGRTSVVSGYGLTTTLYQQPDTIWGNGIWGECTLTHVATSAATNYVFVTYMLGLTDLGGMMLQADGSWYWEPLYSVDFDPRPATRVSFVDQAQFQGVPMPSEYYGKSLTELLSVHAVVTNAVSSAATNWLDLDNSPELRDHPTLDQFVTDMGSNALALASFVQNEIELTDAIAYNNDTNKLLDTAINLGGVNRGALGTYLEGQGSPVEQCALLIYLLRRAGVPAGYIYPPYDGVQMVDAGLSKLLQVQLRGAVTSDGFIYTTNSLISVNYPWVAAYVDGQWVHLFPWLKDTSVTEGLNLYDYMPTNYNNGAKWADHYIRNDTNIFSLSASADTPDVLFPNFIQNALLTTAPGVSIDDLGITAFNRRVEYSRWSDFPTPFAVTNGAVNTVHDLTSITNLYPTFTNIFDTVGIQIYSTSATNKSLFTGDLRTCDLHDRKFIIRQQTNGANYILTLSLAPYRSSLTNVMNFTNDPALLKPQQMQLTLASTNDNLTVHFNFKRHRTLPAAVTNYSSYLAVNEVLQYSSDSSIRLGDLAAICLDLGRVSQKMLTPWAQEYWNMQNQVKANPSITNSLSPDTTQGTLPYLMGMAYYERTDKFDAKNQALHKVRLGTQVSIGLSLLSAQRNTSGQLILPLKLYHPAVDMFIEQVSLFGNQSIHLDYGSDFYANRDDYIWISNLEGSAQEHQIIDDFYTRTGGVSTVKLLRQAQQAGQPGMFELNINTYASHNNLSTYDSGIWKQVTNVFASGPGQFAIVYITAAPITNTAASYKGMGALVYSRDVEAALISGNQLPQNGGWGIPLTDPIYNPPDYNYNNLTFNSSDYSSGGSRYDSGWQVSYSAPSVGTPAFLSESVSWWDTASTYGFISSGAINWGWNPFDSLQFNYASYYLNLPTASTYQDTVDNGSGYGPAVGPEYAQLAGTVSDPVNAVSGEFYIEATDLSLPGQMPLLIRRNYSSQNVDMGDSPFGCGWRPAYQPYLRMVSTNLIYATEMDGTVVAYRQPSPGTNYWKPTAADNPELNNRSVAGIGSTANLFNNYLTNAITGGATNYYLSGADGSVRFFQYTNYPVVGTNGTGFDRYRPYLQQWTDVNGNNYAFSFQTDNTQPDYGQVHRIQSSSGNFLVFNYDSFGHITDAYTEDGRRLHYEYDTHGDLIAVTFPDESQINYAYQHSTIVTNSMTNVVSSHLLLTEQKPDGRLLSNSYDSLRRVVTQAATVGSDLRLVTNATFIYSNNFTNLTNSIITGTTYVKDVFGKTNSYQYTSNFITGITDQLGQSITQVWFTNSGDPGYYPHSLKSRTDKRGLKTDYQHDSLGNLSQVTLTGNLTGGTATNETATYQFTYTSRNLLSTATDPLTNQVVCAYTNTTFPMSPTAIVRQANGVPISTNQFFYTSVVQVVTNGAVSTNSSFGLASRVIRGGFSTNDFAYDGRGFLAQAIRYTGTGDPAVTNTLLYTDRGELKQSTDAAGRSKVFAYDGMGRVTAEEVYEANATTPEGFNYSYYNENGELVWTDGPRYNPEDYIWRDYDGAGRKITEIHWRSAAFGDGSGVTADPANLYSTTFYQYDSFGNLTQINDPLGNYIVQSFDAIGQLTGQVFFGANGVALATNRLAYEPGGQVAFATNALGGVTTKQYTFTGKPRFQQNPDGSTNSWQYDLSGRVVNEFLPNGNFWQTVYNDAGNTITRYFNNGSGVLATNIAQFDARGNAIQTTDAEGNTFTNLFDGLDRIKIAAGPAIVSVIEDCGISGSGCGVYVTNVLQHAVTNFYDNAGVTSTNVNALGEKTIATFDALGRTTRVEVRSATGTSVRVTTTAYSADHQSVTVTNGTGASAVATTTYTDNAGHALLTITYPTNGVREYIWRQYDAAENRIAEDQCSYNGAVSVWATNVWTYDGLNRVKTGVIRDGALTTYGYDALGDVTNRAMPGGLTWSATYLNDGRISTEQVTGGSQTARSMTYSYYAAGNPFAGKLQTLTDGRGTSRTNSYDDFLRLASVNTGGSLAEQQTSTTFQYDLRNLLINLVQSFNSTNTGPSTTILRAFDSYGQLGSESVSIGSEDGYSMGQSWDAAGRRSQLNLPTGGLIGFAYRADGLMTVASGSSFGYGDTGLLTGRTNSSRSYTINQRDGRGRVLQTTTSVGMLTALSETLNWRNDGRLSNYSAVRDDFTDTRNYTYSAYAQRLTQEAFNTASGQRLTNNYTIDRGTNGGLGLLTSSAQSGSVSSTWSVPTSGGLDGLSRVAQSQNTTINRPATGLALGAANVAATLDNNPVSVQFDGTDADGRWRASLDLTPGSHTLRLSAVHPSGLYTAFATNIFTANGGATDTVTNQYDGEGNITKRLWISGGATNRTQTLTWDAFDRLIKVSDRNVQGSGFDHVSIYDGFGRRARTIYTMVVSNAPITNPSDAISTVDSWYDPQVEFLEVGVSVNGSATTKIYGPDADGTYGGMNGVGGLEAIAHSGQVNPIGVVQDVFGNVQGTITNGAVAWNPTRVSSYGPVPGYQSPALSLNTPLEKSIGWRGRRVDESGFVYLGARHYDPVAGRFASADPLGHAASMDLYSFAGGDPVNFFDPSGRFGRGSFDISTVPNVAEEVRREEQFIAAASGLVDFVPILGGLKMWGELNSGRDLFTGERIDGNDYAQAAGIILNFLAVLPPALSLGTEASVAGAGATFTTTEAGLAGAEAQNVIRVEFAAAEAEATLPYRQGVNYSFTTFNESLGAAPARSEGVLAATTGAAEGGAYSAIGSTGQVGEQWLAQNLGGESQVFFNTTQGGRYVDQLVGDIANESKVGYQSLTPSIQLQISKDAELLNGGTFQSVNWHFFQSPVTGLGGPSQPLMNALQQNGINVIIH